MRSATPSSRPLRAIFWISGFLFTAAILVWLAIGYIWPSGQNSGQSEIYIGDLRFEIPASYIRFDHAKSGGRLPEVDLAVSSKNFRPAQPGKITSDIIPDRETDTLYLTLLKPDARLKPSERPARLYFRFLKKLSWSHAGGLTMRRFEDSSPYAREDLYYAPPEGRMFAARCRRPKQPPDGLPNTCIAEFRISGIDVRMRFSPNLLADWERLADGVSALVQSFRK